MYAPGNHNDQNPESFKSYSVYITLFFGNQGFF